MEGGDGEEMEDTEAVLVNALSCNFGFLFIEVVKSEMTRDKILTQ